MNTMSLTRIYGCAAAVIVSLGVASASRATVFFTDTFSYENGSLTTQSGGLWTTTGTTSPGQLQVVDGNADVLLSAGEDVSRSTGSVIPEGGSWYYAALLTVKDLRADNTQTIPSTNYFMHFKDEGTFSLRSRLYLRPPTDTNLTATGFTFGISAGSLTGGGAQVPYTPADFLYNTPIIVVAKYTSADGDPMTPDEGFGQLWVNPVDASSPSVIDNLPNPTSLTDDSMSRLSLRQGSSSNVTSPEVLVNTVSIGDSFAEVLAAVTPTTPAFDADFDGDLDVDGNDFLIWQRGLGTGTANADGNTDGDTDVDATDLANWKAAFGLPVPPAVSAAAAVPEPACASLLAIGLGVLVRRRR
jgi:hypothetical protein